MSYWHTVVDEVKNKSNKGYAFLFTDHGRLCAPEDILLADAQSEQVVQKRDLRTYYLGEKYPGVYFTKREAESMFWMAHGLTIYETGLKMSLSHRTIEFYVKNMKIKLGCASKKRLIEKVLTTDLIDQLKQEGMTVTLH